MRRRSSGRFRLALDRAGAALAAAAAATVFAGCPDTATGPTEKADTTVQTLLAVCARGEGEAVLDLLTPPARGVFIEQGSVFEGCDAVLDLGIETEVLAPEIFRDAVVEDVHVDDDIGTATISSPDGNTSELELENTGDQWLVFNPRALGPDEGR